MNGKLDSSKLHRTPEISTVEYIFRGNIVQLQAPSAQGPEDIFFSKFLPETLEIVAITEIAGNILCKIIYNN